MGTAQACLSLHLSKYHTVGNYMPRFIVFIYFNKKQDNLGQELQCTIKVKENLSKVLNFQDAKINVFKLIKIEIVSFFPIVHNDVFDHKKCIGPGNLLSI